MIKVWQEGETNETLNEAYARIAGESYDETKAQGVRKVNDLTYLSMPGKYMIVKSLSGEASIYEKDNLP